MAKRLITKVRECLSKLDLPYFKKMSVTEIDLFSSWKSFKLDFDLPFNSIQSIVRFCEDNDCCMSFDKEEKYVELTVFDPAKLNDAILGDKE